MLPLSMTAIGDTQKVMRITGKDETRRFLESLGFVEGAEVSVVSEISGNMIVNVKNVRVAIDKAMAQRIQVA